MEILPLAGDATCFVCWAVSAKPGAKASFPGLGGDTWGDRDHSEPCPLGLPSQPGAGPFCGSAVRVCVCECVRSACVGSCRARSPRTLLTGLEGARVSAAGVSVPCRWPFSPLPSSLFFFYKRQKNKWKAKLAEVFKYFILVSNVNSYIVIAVLGVFRLHVTFCNIFVNH